MQSYIDYEELGKYDTFKGNQVPVTALKEWRSTNFLTKKVPNNHLKAVQ